VPAQSRIDEDAVLKILGKRCESVRPRGRAPDDIIQPRSPIRGAGFNWERLKFGQVVANDTRYRRVRRRGTENSWRS
jgi:hypothetical protein